MVQDKKSVGEVFSRFAKWLAVESNISLWNMFSMKGLPPAIVLEHIAEDKILTLSVFMKFLVEDYKMTTEDARKTTQIFETEDLSGQLRELFMATADKFDI